MRVSSPASTAIGAPHKSQPAAHETLTLRVIAVPASTSPGTDRIISTVVVCVIIPLWQSAPGSALRQTISLDPSKNLPPPCECATCAVRCAGARCGCRRDDRVCLRPPPVARGMVPLATVKRSRAPGVPEIVAPFTARRTSHAAPRTPHLARRTSHPAPQRSDEFEVSSQSSHPSELNAASWQLSADFHKYGGIRPAMHPDWRRCSSLTYSRCWLSASLR